MLKRVFVILSFFIFLLLGNNLKGALAMKLSSPDFKNNTLMPLKFSCQGQGINPTLIIENIPKEAKSLALIVDDPDALLKTYVHWVVYDIPVITRIEENSIPGTQGVNSSGALDYVSPCPPTGTHRYFFKTYALDQVFSLDDGMSSAELEKAMQGHILDKTELVGLYKKK
jgi:Raf kinase inhibitor-like YbhB/YbcL family protein